MSKNKYSEYNPSKKTRAKIEVECRLASTGDEKDLANIHYERDGGFIDELIINYSTEIDNNGKNNTLIVALIGGLIIGFGRYRFIEADPDLGYENMPRGFYLLGLIVKNEYRRLGVGEALVKERLKMIRKDANMAYTFVDEVNQSMKSLLDKLGFKKITSDFVYPRLTDNKKRELFEINLKEMD